MGAFPFLNNQIIAEGVKPPDIPDPMVSMQNALKVQQLRQQNATFPITQQHLQAQTGELQANAARIGIANTAAQRDMDEEKQTKEELSAAGPDPENIKARALKISNPKIQASMLDVAGKMETRNATMTAKKHDEYAKQLLGIANNLETIKKATGPMQLGLWAQEVQDAYALKDENGKALIPPGTLDPATVPPPEVLQTLQDHVDQFGQFHLQQAKLKEDAGKAAKAEEDRKKVAGENLKEMHAEAYAALQGADSKESWNQAVSDFAAQDKDHADYAKRFLNVLPYGGDGKRALSILKSRSIPADKQVSEDIADKRAAVAGGKAGLASRATDPTASPEDRKAAADALALLEKNEGRQTANSIALQSRFDRRELDRDNDQHSKLSDKAEQQNKLADEYTEAAASEIDKPIIDPKSGIEKTLSEPLRNYFLTQAKANRKLADDAKSEMQKLEKKNKWGQFNEQDAPPVSALKEGFDRKFKDGKGTWTLKNGKAVRVDKAQ